MPPGTGENRTPPRKVFLGTFCRYQLKIKLFLCLCIENITHSHRLLQGPSQSPLYSRHIILDSFLLPGLYVTPEIESHFKLRPPLSLSNPRCNFIPSIHDAVISVFQRKELGENELYTLNEGVRSAFLLRTSKDI